MKFFIPAAKDAEQAEEVYQVIHRHAHDQLGWDIADTRIYSVDYVADGKFYASTVGEPDPRIKEVVIAILESNSYLVCTGSRRVVKGGPILIGRPLEVTEFDS